MPACSISSITSSELAPADAVITGNFTAQLRAARNNGSARIYTLHVTCADRAGNTTEKCVDVRVAKEGDASNPMHAGGKRDLYTLAKREWKEALRQLLARR
jgi:hypothetical protein